MANKAPLQIEKQENKNLQQVKSKSRKKFAGYMDKCIKCSQYAETCLSNEINRAIWGYD